LTNLTELGPDDGGTVVIAGSHKVKAPQEQIIACAYENPSLIHQVIAPAGSTLLFGEALVHATGQIRSDRERVIIIAGYTPPMFQAWNGQEPSADFLASVPDVFKPLISGSDKWRWQPRFRSLDMPFGDKVAG
jgi:ectoine hydroxylase-related dioxygenase (phytanoyl-CoA dioxygenase family)